MVIQDNSLSNLNFKNLRREASFAIDMNGIITYIDSSIENILGYTSTTIIGTNLYQFISKELSYFRFSFSNSSVSNIQLPLIHKSGNTIYVDINYQQTLDSNNNIVGIHGTMLNITNYKQQEQRLKFLEKLLDNSKDIIYYAQMIPERKFLYISKSLEAILGHSVEEDYSDFMTVFRITHPDDVKELDKKGTHELDYSKPLVTRWQHKDGHYIWFEDFITPEFNENGDIIAVQGVCRDVSEKIELEKKLKFLTYHDSLTGLKNRLFFDEEIKKFDSIIDTPIGIIICDLDNLKTINDSFGHKAGDALIKSAANILSKHITKNMFIARIGGDEFAIVINNTNYCEVKKLCRDIRIAIDEHNLINDCTVEISIGYAFNEKSIGQVDQLIKIADRRMYIEKSKHKNMAY